MRVNDFSLASPWALLSVVPVLALTIYKIWRRRGHRDPTLSFSALGLVEALPRSIFARLAWLPDALRLLALFLIAFALARPQLVGPPGRDESEGIDIILALDTSCSMLAADFQPKDRISVAKKSIQEFILRRKTDRLGLVVFAGEAASWVPLTIDYSLLARMLDQVEVGMIEDGTAIGNAIGTALNRLRESSAESKVIVLITDGDNNAGAISPHKAAEFAKELGVRVFTILIGRGGAVPFPAGKDLFGRVVYEQREIATNPDLLREIAGTTKGEAYSASDKEELDAHLGDVLDRLKKTKTESNVQLVAYAELFPYAVLAAVLCLVLELALSATRFRRFP